MLVVLSQDMTIAQAGPLKARLLVALQGGGEVLLDARAVAEVDLVGLQLLEAAWLSGAARGCKLAFSPGGRSALLDRAAADAGLTREPASGAWKEASCG